MAKFNVMNKNMMVGYADILRIQLSIYCLIHKINLSNNEMNCLLVLLTKGSVNMSSFCKLIADSKIFKSSQSVRNFLTKAEQIGLVKKDGKMKKNVMFNNDIKILISGNILLKYNIAYVSKEK